MKVANIAVKKIIMGKKQPRQHFDQEALHQLAGSIQEVGQLQPIIVKQIGENYQLIAGERRFRAVKKNNQPEIAAVILEEGVNNPTLRQIQLVENLQREDLNPLERALSIQAFIRENDLSKKEASHKLGVPRTTLTEWLNILDVDEKYRQEVIEHDSPLSLSHISIAKALVSRTGDPTKLKKLLDGVLQFKLSRSETKEVSEIIYRYLHISVDEAIGAILLRREHQKIVVKEKSNLLGNKNSPVKGLLKNLVNLSENIEGLIDKVARVEEGDQQDIIDEFLYIYQMLAIMIPPLNNQQLDQIIGKLKNS